MPLPKFSVGEEVILCSKTHPELNGEAVVLKVFETLEERVGYLLTIKAPRAKGWYESALRKKHQPGEMNFTNLMNSLKSPVVA